MDEHFVGYLNPPNYIVADGQLIDQNKLKPSRVRFPWGECNTTDRQIAPWYTAHYQALTKGIDALEYNTW
jgi:hypothetical protein